MTEGEINKCAGTLIKPDKNKTQAQCKYPMSDEAKAVVKTFLLMVYKAFDRQTKIL